ncbi:MAG: GGDEF domain-containing protein [Butyrivibrio sp.]|nr:GGDEF domain-containing protein [Butyrivibrio sp.]
MIQKLFQFYDDSEYYIETNKKKLAYDNVSVIRRMLTFFVFITVLYILTGIAFGGGIPAYSKYFPALLAVVIVTLVNDICSKNVRGSFIISRIYCTVVYTLVIVTFSAADIIIYSGSRAVFFPCAILVLTMLYIDRISYAFLFKSILALIFILIDIKYKTTALVISDLTVVTLSIFASSFSYLAIITTALSRREDNIKLVKMSQTDLLTGLLNKVSFEERCTEYLDRKMNGAKCTMFIFDLDNFKNVNDQYGHAAGDKVIKFFAETLWSYFHPDDIIGRIGGDEFMVLVLGEMPDDFPEIRCRSVLHELKTSNIDGITGMTCSMGFAIETGRISFGEIYAMADKALYKAKENGKAQYHRYQAND